MYFLVFSKNVVTYLCKYNLLHKVKYTTYEAAETFLFTQLPMYSRVGASAYKKDLTNTIALCNYIGNPHNTFKTIHIAGTNGKGSTSHMLAAILQTAGYRTGLYTSPHLYTFKERIKINGEMIPEQAVIDFCNTIQPVLNTIYPSFFEITVAMAYQYFAQQKVDIAIIETGLGGRLDSTNIITPILSIITNISYDHQDILGNTLAEIAYEKAGIIKPNVPIVIGEYVQQTKSVFHTKATTTNSKQYYVQDNYTCHIAAQTAQHLTCTVTNANNATALNYTLDLNGAYQAKNLCTVLQALQVLQPLGYIISEADVQYGLQQSKQINGLQGRWQVLQTNPLVVLDVAHNEAGIMQVIAQLATLQYCNLHIVLGMVKDKDISKALALLPTKATYYFTQADIPRALTANELQSKAANFKLNGNEYANVNIALTQAKLQATENDCVLVCGSIFLVAEVHV